MLARVPWIKPVAKVANARKLSKDRRRHLVETVAAILRLGQPTHFAFEGTCWHGLRSELCLDGWTWPEADHVAADIVATALRQLGASRPTWQQGQPEWTEEGVLRIERENCARCRKPLPADRGIGSGIPLKYCSVECNVAAANVNWRNRMSVEQRIQETLAGRTRRKRAQEAKPDKNCAFCNDVFKPYPTYGGKPEPIFCSPRCRNKARSRRSKVLLSALL